MSYTQTKNGADTDILVYDYEKGIAPSPHKGIGNIQNANIATETGEIMASYGRLQQSMTNSSANGTLAYGGTTARVTLNIPGTNNKLKGMWINVSNSSDTGQLANGLYYILDSITSGSFLLATSYNGSAITGFLPGLTATISLFRNVGKPIQYTTETYYNGTGIYHRYYILDDQGLVWMYDTINDIFPNDDQNYWVLPDPSISYFSGLATPSGLCVLNGWLIVAAGNTFEVKPTVNLGSSYTQMTNAYNMSTATSLNPHRMFVGHQGRAYYTDGPYVGSIFPDTSLEVSGLPNIQSFASYSASTTTCTITQLISGTVPSDGNITSVRVPVVFFPSTGGTKPTNVTVGVVYYIQFSTANQNFQVFAASTGGSAIDMSGGSGTQYYNTFYPLGTHAGTSGDHTTMVFSPQRLGLPIFETSQCMTEVGNNLVVGTKSQAIYPWNQVDATPSSIIFLPEADTQQLLTVNQMAYIFSGYKGNIYITDGSTASLVLKVPDYCAGIAGTPSSYIEPNFIWGGVMYLRGRVYFSVEDQTLVPSSSSQLKAGNCGGVWSFYPTQNIAYGQDTGLALRLENQNSYGTYNGYATVLIPWFDQNALKSPQYWSGWTSSIVVADQTFGIDKTYTAPTSTVIFESDFLPVGTYLNKYTPKQIEYKLAAPLVAGESIQVYWRKNTTDAWTSAGNVIRESNTALSGYFNANFQGAQWVQLRTILTPLFDTTTSFTRLAQLRMR